MLHNPSGLHARLAAAVVRAVQGRDALVTLTNLDRDAEKAANASSILALLGLGARAGDRLRVHATGPEAQGAISAISAVLSATREPRPSG